MIPEKALEKFKEINLILCKREKELATMKYDNLGRKEKLVKFEMDAYAEVTSEKNSDGKAAYTNDRQREAEVTNRLDSHRTYKTMKEQYTQALLDIDLCVADIHCNTRLYNLMTLYYGQTDQLTGGTEFE